MREFVRYVESNPAMPDEIGQIVGAVTDPDELGDAVAAHMMIPFEQEAAAAGDRRQRRSGSAKCCGMLVEENAVLDMERDLNQKVQDRIETTQRQIFLHEKLKVIRDELDHSAESEDEIGPGVPEAAGGEEDGRGRGRESCTRRSAS